MIARPGSVMVAQLSLLTAQLFGGSFQGQFERRINLVGFSMSLKVETVPHDDGNVCAVFWAIMRDNDVRVEGMVKIFFKGRANLFFGVATKSTTKIDLLS